MRYLIFLLSVFIGYSGPALLLNLALYFDWLELSGDSTSASLPEGFAELFLGGYMWVLLLSVPVAIAALFSNHKKFRQIGLWAPAIAPCFYAALVLLATG